MTEQLSEQAAAAAVTVDAAWSFTTAPDVNSVQFGGDPHVVLEAGEMFTTSDPILAAELAENPYLVEVESAGSKPRKRGGKP